MGTHIAALALAPTPLLPRTDTHRCRAKQSCSPGACRLDGQEAEITVLPAHPARGHPQYRKQHRGHMQGSRLGAGGGLPARLPVMMRSFLCTSW